MDKSEQERMDYALMTEAILRLLSHKRKFKEGLENQNEG